jgi:ribosome-associated protein
VEKIEPSSAKEIAIESEYITLGQFLKFAGIIHQGGEAKSYLLQNKVLVNQVDENRRGRKLRPGDDVLLPEGSFKIVSK